MIEVKAPNSHSELDRDKKIFVAGSIETGTATNWQQWVAEVLAPYDIVLLNPRRDRWDSSWEQSIDNPEFLEQVTWELDGIDEAELCIFHFEPTTFSPITLMELGYVAANADKKCVVSCPNGFWRKGNVEVMCARSGIILYHSLDDMLTDLKKALETERC